MMAWLLIDTGKCLFCEQDKYFFFRQLLHFWQWGYVFPDKFAPIPSDGIEIC
jgi:hypothetical protein